MRKILYINFSVLMLFGAISCVILFIYIGIEKNSNGYLSTETDRLGETARYFNEELFIKGEINKEVWDIKGCTKGAIIPHHSLAGKYISSYFNSLAKESIDTVILIGPNHKAVGDKVIYTSDLVYKTEFGPLDTDNKLVEHLLNDEFIGLDNDIVEDEHSVITIFPYLTKYFSNLKVIPLVVNETGLENITVLADFISNYVTENTLIIAAVDFSHYLTAEEATTRDRKTISLIKNKDHGKILELNNEYLDSPTSLVLQEKIIEKSESAELRLLKNVNSYDLTGRKDGVTSYMFGVYCE